MYYAYDRRLEVDAEKYQVEPFNILQELCMREALGQLEAPKMTLRRNKFGRNRLSQNLRLASYEEKKDKKKEKGT